MKRTLTLTKERLTELTTDELVTVVGGTTTITKIFPHSFGLPICLTDGCD